MSGGRAEKTSGQDKGERRLITSYCDKKGDMFSDYGLSERQGVEEDGWGRG